MNIFSESRKFKSEAKSRLNVKNCTIYFLAILIMWVLIIGTSLIQESLVDSKILNRLLDTAFNLFISSLLWMGITYITVGIFRGNATLKMLFKPFAQSYWRVVLLNIIKGLRIVVFFLLPIITVIVLKALGVAIGIGAIIFVLSLFSVIPAVMLIYSYEMANYIFEENPDLDPSEILDRSSKMMKGHRWQLFMFQLSFTGWFLLAICTCGLALIYVAPYYAVSHVSVYNALKNEEISEPSDQIANQ